MTTPALAILAADLRGSWNVVRRGGAPRRRLIGVLVAAVVLGPPFLGGGLLAGYASAREGADATPLFAGAFTSLTVLIMVLGLSTVITAFFADRVLLLLALAPIRPRDVFLARLVSASVPGFVVGALVLAVTVGYGVGWGADAGYYAAALLAVALTVVSAVCLLVCVLSVVLRVVPARRARDVANLVAALLAAAFYLGWYGFLRGGGTAFGPGSLQRLASTGRGLASVPTAWPGRGLAAWAAGDAVGAATWLGLGLAAALALLGSAWLAYRNAFVVGVGVYGESGAQLTRRPSRRASRRQVEEGVGEGSARPVRALAYKDLLAVRRDMRRLAGVLPAIVMAIAYPLLILRGPNLPGALGFWLGMTGSAFAPFLLSSVIALPSVGLEGRGMKLLLLAGTPAETLLRAKLAYAVPVVTALGVGGGVAAAWFRAGSAGELLAAGAALAWLSAGMAGIGVGAGAIAPNFEASDPRRVVRFTGGLVSMAADVGFVALSFGTVVAALVARATAAPLATALWAVAVFLAAAAAAVVLVVLAAGRRALARWRPDED